MKGRTGSVALAGGCPVDMRLSVSEDALEEEKDSLVLG